jgi:predicted transcriptional regulator of viral defense system
MKRRDRRERGALGGYIDELATLGRYTFSAAEVSETLGYSGLPLEKAVRRLAAQGRLTIARRGFYVIVPIEYRTAGAPPATWFIDDLMKHLGRDYYIGVLSAAAQYGATHQQPQEFQVVTEMVARPANVGRSRIRFLHRKHMAAAIATTIKTPTGYARISTPESTALDLVRYAHAAGGLSNVATVLSTLGERMDAEALAEAASHGDDLPVAQRLGYLLEVAGQKPLSRQLATWIAGQHPRIVNLQTGRVAPDGPVAKPWNVRVNEHIEPDEA